ncbi:MAG: nuclear transport factor 2 family protein [Pseudomonadota bacterium]
MTRPLTAAALAVSLAFPGIATADTPPPAGDPDSARVITLVTSIPVAVDRGAYDLAEAAFAPEVVIDYTSVWGGEPVSMSPAALMEAWQGIVPGFDATWHALGPVTVEIAGDSATASAAVDGRHWIGDRLWRPIGSYHWDLARMDGDWKVTRMVFEMTQEIGDRGLADEARAKAAQ